MPIQTASSIRVQPSGIARCSSRRRRRHFQTVNSASGQAGQVNQTISRDQRDDVAAVTIVAEPVGPGAEQRRCGHGEHRAGDDEGGLPGPARPAQQQRHRDADVPARSRAMLGAPLAARIGRASATAMPPLNGRCGLAARP